MKTSWIIGIMMMYLIIMGLEMWATGGTTFSNNVTTNQSTLTQPSMTESSNIFTGAWAVMTGVATYIVSWLGIFVLWSPTVFSGYLIWLWWGICFPVDVGMVFGVVGIVRGVHSA
jgi:hypothetical protein